MARVRTMMPRRCTLIRAALGTALMIAAGSCAAPPKPQLAPRMPPPLVVAPPALPLSPPAQAGGWDELPVIEGGWRYDAAQRRARFFDDSGLERASLACSAPGRSMRLAIAGDSATATTLLTSAGTNQIALANGTAELGINDIALDRIAFSRGRFGLRSAQLLVLPVQAEIGRVIEDCRG